jgi:hypothetical protein
MIDDYKYLFIIFVPGGGGNHLANILARNPKIESRTFTEDGNELLYKYYTEELATGNITEGLVSHPTNIVSVQNLSNIMRCVVDIKKSNKVVTICSHAYEFGHHCSAPVFPKFLLSKTGYILFSYPKEGSPIYNRHRHGAWYYGEDYNTMPTVEIDSKTYNIRDLYDKELFSKPWGWIKKPHINPKHIYQFESEKFFDANGFDYLNDFLEQNFGITLDEKAKEMHEIYLKTQL